MNQPHDQGQTPDWSLLPEPEDDGAGRRLEGLALPSVLLPSTGGAEVDLSSLSGRTVVYIYPMTGRPDVALPDGWDGIPGARGCTPQSCSFRDHYTDLQAAGVQHLYGLSVQDTPWQSEAAERMHLPFELLSDKQRKLSGPLELPTFEADGMTLLKRMAWVVDNGLITKVFYPVFPPDRNAADVLAWVQENG